jgi:CarD family transcriptional regulator
MGGGLGRGMFGENETIVHPRHGVGRISGVEQHEVHGRTARYVTIAFGRSMLTLRIPEEKIESSGVRLVSSEPAMRSALDVLQEPATSFSGHWSKRQVQLQEKLNSGDPRCLAELIRDLSRQKSLPDGRVRREAILRLAEELAVVNGVELAAAQESIVARLSPEAS